jgi:RNA polymerase sigma factor (sigma-70 family)
MDQQELIPHLFRTESGKISAVLCKLLGLEHTDMAQDIAAETFLSALEIWPYKGVPVNPVAWLYTVAKNKARNHITRERLLTGKIIPQLRYDNPATLQPDIDLSEKNINDSQLQMLFAVCHPSIPAEAQVALALRVLCGFGIDEIAHAFLSNRETINKRLSRAKEKWRTEKIQIEFPPAAEIGNRLDTVLTTLYLLFNEGYYSETSDSIIREELSQEAMRLTYQLIQYEPTNLPRVNALFALMCFHASRFAARKDRKGQVVLYADQDESLWNQELIAKGAYFLREASQGNDLSRYHIEAGIAYWHTIKTGTKEKWENILQLYNRLLQLEYSPIAALNRTYALSKVQGNKAAILEAKKLSLYGNPYYHILLGDLYTGLDNTKAKECYAEAFATIKTITEKNLVEKKMQDLG